MPYIEKSRRHHLLEEVPQTPGELNFLFTSIALDYLQARGKSYQTYNDVVGALECCKLEMYRRSIGPYEDLKIQENGDVY